MGIAWKRLVTLFMDTTLNNPLRVNLIIVGAQEKEDQEGRLERLFGVHPPGKSDPLSQKPQVFLPSHPVN